MMPNSCPYLSLMKLRQKICLNCVRQVNVAGRRIETFKYLGGLTLKLSGYHYQAGDSNCCPSEHVTVIYSVEREDFKEKNFKISKMNNWEK